MGVLLWLLSAFLLIWGVLTLLDGAILGGAILILLGLFVGGGGFWGGRRRTPL